jgi:4-amino-4-deoxy-L-arabinose transferase-like glycosyltransferase
MFESLKNPNSRWLLLVLIGVWAVLFLPNLRTNPKWYGDEGCVMELSWTTAHGTPRWGAAKMDFLVPSPYQPLYLLVNGALLRVFGNDIVVGRAFQAVIGLATAFILLWIGTRLLDRRFGMLCALAFLFYPEVVMHYRWVRPHPAAGTFVLATCGFLIQYIQDKRLRNLLWAGAMASLATGCHVFAYPVVGLVILTALFVNWRHTPAAIATACAWGGLFVLWFLWSQPGGWSHLMAQVQRISPQDEGLGFVGQIVQVYRFFIEFSFLTPTVGADGQQGVDFWMPIALLGAFLFPVRRYRKWLALWLVILMCGVFKSRGNVPVFYYPALCFVPLMAIGFAGAIVRVEELLVRWLPKLSAQIRWVPAAAIIGVFAIISLNGSLGHWRSKIDRWMMLSPADAEAAMSFVRANTTDDDYVMLPDQVYWLYPRPLRGQMIQSAHYEGKENAYYPGKKPLDREQFWFDCRWQKAKYLVLAYGTDANGRPYGIDAIFWMSFKSVRDIIEQIQKENWPVVFRQGEFMVLANPRFMTPPAPAK